MKDQDIQENPLVVEATLEGDRLELVLTREGYEALAEIRDMLRLDDPDATMQDALFESIACLRDELEALDEIAMMN